VKLPRPRAKLSVRSFVAAELKIKKVFPRLAESVESEEKVILISCLCKSKQRARRRSVRSNVRSHLACFIGVERGREFEKKSQESASYTTKTKKSKKRVKKLLKVFFER
jgi:hypothetical protein